MSSFHPLVSFVYFVFVIGFSMFFMHPVWLGISLVCAVVYNKGFGLRLMLPMMVAAAVVNPLFNHQGVTILAHLPNENPLTLEAVLFGVAAAVMIGAVITWFSCFNYVMTSDKFVYLFGRVMPALSLILAMSLRLVPRFRAQFTVISNAQKGIGRGKNLFKIISIMVTWALENSIETADSMKSRGYGLPGRTAFSIFRFCRRDFYALGYIFVNAGIVIFSVLSGGFYFRFFPVVGGVGGVFVFAALFLLAAFPIIVKLKEEITWKRLESKI
ncbi:MAG: energy-coupling factor transporter transmembrane protein EcfT [Defluviitaleaceae bacterium]|nr:energy-coupling factor transporter transmembrane protein EcfT [Defluviitaleaceae bacterium]